MSEEREPDVFERERRLVELVGGARYVMEELAGAPGPLREAATLWLNERERFWAFRGKSS